MNPNVDDTIVSEVVNVIFQGVHHGKLNPLRSSQVSLKLAHDETLCSEVELHLEDFPRQYFRFLRLEMFAYSVLILFGLVQCLYE